MHEVKIAELKARLSHYLRLAEKGEEVLVKDRDRPMVRLIGYEGPPRKLQTIPPRLTREQAQKILDTIPRPKLSRKVVAETLRWMKEDRADRWFPKKQK